MRKPRKLRKLGYLEQDTLSQLSSGDLLVGMLLSGRSTKAMFATARARAARRQATQRAIARLDARGFVERDQNILHLTPKGRKVLDYTLAAMQSGLDSKKKEWDGYWRLISFDIPERARGARDALRRVLKRAGFCQLQQSVWIHPYDCSELQGLLEEDARLTHSVVYATVSRLSDEVRILKHFKLRRKSDQVEV